jgi:hypothetical protein
MSCGEPHITKVKIIELTSSEEGWLELDVDGVIKKVRFIAAQRNQNIRAEITQKLQQSVGREIYLRGEYRDGPEMFDVYGVN